MSEEQLHAYVILYDILEIGVLKKRPDEKDYRAEWNRILPLFEYMSLDTSKEFYGAIMAQLKEKNPVPLGSFVRFFMYPPSDVFNPYTNHRFLVSLNEVLAQAARKTTEFQWILHSLLTLESPVLTFLLERTSGTARTILGGYPRLKGFLPSLSCKNGRSVEDLYRMSVDRHYHTLATVFDWLVQDFPGSFDATKVDPMTFSSMEPDGDKQKRIKQTKDRIDSLKGRFHISTTNNQDLIDRIKTEIPNYRSDKIR